MKEVYEVLYEEYSDAYRRSYFYNGIWYLSHPQAVCNHAQIDKILKACNEDALDSFEDVGLILEAMHSCIGCIGDSVPALED